MKAVEEPEAVKVLGSCPACSGSVVAGTQNYYCLNRRSGCSFTVWHNALAMLGHKCITESEIKKLLKKKTPLKLKKTDGRVYEGVGQLEKNGERWSVRIDFEAGLKAETLGVCPLCGKEIVESPLSYGCSAWREGCGFAIYKDALRRFGGKKLTKTDAKRFLEEGEMTVELRRKNGAIYQKNAFLDENFGLRIDFDGDVR